MSENVDATKLVDLEVQVGEAIEDLLALKEVLAKKQDDLDAAIGEKPAEATGDCSWSKQSFKINARHLHPIHKYFQADNWFVDIVSLEKSYSLHCSFSHNLIYSRSFSVSFL